MNILGIHGNLSCNQHDPGSAIICDGKIIAVCEEERFNRIKSARGHLPIFSIQACLKQAGLTMEDIDYVVHPGSSYDDLADRISLYLKHYFGHVPKIELINHQIAHLASSFYCSGYDEAMCISYDGVGDQKAGALAVADRINGVNVLEWIEEEDSLGHLYGALTVFLGFGLAEDEYKVMGLAPYGNDVIDFSKVCSLTDSGFKINSSIWERQPRIRSIAEPIYNLDRMAEIFGAPRLPSAPVTQAHRDLSCSLQRTLEACVVRLITSFQKRTGLRKLCLSGGVALNCSANRHIYNLPFIDDLFVQPASSDRGLALGCALEMAFRQGTPAIGLDSVYLGPDRNLAEIEHAFVTTGFSKETLRDPSETAAELIASGKVIGWFQGRSEFGPRALGNRSILADPTHPQMKDIVNSKIKYREAFRPFAPAVLLEKSQEIYDIKSPLPTMTVAVDTRNAWRSRLPSTTHVDGSSRVQTVARFDNPMYHKLIECFERLKGAPVVLNTSFNIKGQPIVETPLNALETFAGSGLDACIIGPYLIRKK